MNLTEIQIDCHGVWRNVTLPVPARGVSVFYGPNESGKSTLRRFIMGVLFGFSQGANENADGAADGLPAAGSLNIQDGSGSYRIHRIHRAVVGAPSADACLITDEAARPSGALLESFLKGVDENVFERVFAVGLRELTELNSLSDDDVAQHLY